MIRYTLELLCSKCRDEGGEVHSEGTLDDLNNDAGELIRNARGDGWLIGGCATCPECQGEVDA
jgi:hypothetical protein